MYSATGCPGCAPLPSQSARATPSYWPPDGVALPPAAGVDRALGPQSAAELLLSQATADDDALGLVAPPRRRRAPRHAAPALRADYLTALRRYLDDQDATTLSEAYRIGRAALERGVGLIDVTVVHQHGAGHRAGRAAVAGLARVLRLASSFSADSVGPFEMVRRGFQEANAELFRLNADLKEARRALLAASEATNEFLSRASHELRSPLTAVLGFGELLSSADLSTEHREWVSLILTAARHLLQLLDDVLDVSRAGSGQHPLLVEPVPVEPLVADVLKLVSPQASSRGVHLRPAPTGGTPHARADRQRPRQVLLNLLSNAVKYKHPGGTAAVVAISASGLTQHDLRDLRHDDCRCAVAIRTPCHRQRNTGDGLLNGLVTSDIA